MRRHSALSAQPSLVKPASINESRGIVAEEGVATVFRSLRFAKHYRFAKSVPSPKPNTAPPRSIMSFSCVEASQPLPQAIKKKCKCHADGPRDNFADPLG